MKRYVLNFKRSASILIMPKPIFFTVILLALALSMPLHTDAQRRGGSGQSGFSRGGTSHMGSGFGRSYNGGRSFGNFGHREHWGRGFSPYRGLPYWRYGFFPFWGDYFWGISPYAIGFYLNGFNYYDNDGVYYKYDNDKYQVVPAPIGYKVKKLPKESLQFTLDGVPYSYYFGSYYIFRDGKYEVVPAPVGAEVDSIPEGYEKVIIDGQTYFTLNGVQYKAVMRDNVIWYQVIKNNNQSSEPQNASTNEPPMQENNMTPK